ncbi:RHS repeat-associated core domain-containing protein [Yeosuana marina]|uniref:RHS repeat domain-containing protein n=1 Tax=Yeosuana marina TaxID=1565536 RepID=UPI0030C7BF5A
MRKLFILFILLLMFENSNSQIQSRTLGNKSYEVSNHLGNVMTVVSDRKTPISVSLNTTIAFNETDIKAYNDYYPYGMLLENRNDTKDYRFGFQGQEKDDEIKGKNNSINYKYRVHDPRLGRFFAVDPLSSKYPHNSSYAFSENTVVNAVELEGLEKKEVYNFNLKFPTPEELEMRKYRKSYDKLVNLPKFENGKIIKPISFEDYAEIQKEWDEVALYNKQHLYSSTGGSGDGIWYAVVGIIMAAPAAIAAIGSEAALLWEATPTIINSTRSVAAANTLSGTANMFVELGFSAMNTGDIRNANLTSIANGYLFGGSLRSIFFSSLSSSYAPITINDGFIPISSLSDFKSRTMDFSLGNSFGIMSSGLSSSVSTELRLMDLSNENSGKAMTNYIQFSIESFSGAAANIIKEGVSKDEEK